MAELPYQVEYAKSGRAGCKGCKQKIDQGAIRIAVMVQSAFYDGKQPNWHHEECFFKKQRPLSVGDIANFNKIKSADQKRIKATMENNTGIVMPEAPKAKGRGKKRAAESTAADPNLAALKDFFVEYSKSSRATCRHCEIKICKDEVRISKTVYDTEVGSKYGGQPLWHHVPCFAAKQSELLYFAGGESLPGFNKLKKEDQAVVKSEIKPFKSDEVPVKKLKDEPKDAAELKEEKDKEKKMEKQNKLYHKHRNALSELKKPDLEDLLECNNQELPSGRDECLDRVADMMAFGALKTCAECKQGQLVLDTYGYKCSGHISEYTKCSAVTQTPDRKPMVVPESFAGGSIFKRYKPKTDVRLFETAPRPVVIVKTEANPVIKKELPIPPLKQLQFFLYGKLKDKEGTKRRILKFGGLVVSKLTDTTVAVVSTARDVERMLDKMEEIKSMDIGIVEESFLDQIETDHTIAKSLEIIKNNNIADWGADPATKIPQDVLDGKSIPKSGSMYVKSSKSAVKLKIQGGTAVDPASGLQDEAHVYKNYDDVKYTVVLSQTDVVAQKNSYYKIQVLESDTRKKYWLFRSWGRIGTTIGGTKLEDCRDAEHAMDKFETLYMEKTENPWECRDYFEKVPGRYFPLDMDYGDGDDSSTMAKLAVDSKCNLPEPVQNLIIRIFDVAVMKKTMLEFELDTEKMPLGKLSKKQIKSGYKILSDLLNNIDKGSASQSKIVDATNRFFTLIPHDFGVNNPPLLDNVELIKTKTAMLDNLLEIEIAYSLMQTDSDEASPISAHYLKLKADIAPILTGSPEFDMILEYTRNTHAATHSGYTLDIEQVFKVVREGEDKRYKPFKKLHNRRLLWHGSRVTNYAGILSQGLRIAPPEAPVTGYMFGKGIYFADMVSKSANYCCTNKVNPVGMLLLCEVALGNMKECLKAENVKLPPNTHSAWGVGSTCPDPAMNRVLDNGTIVPLGTPVNHKSQSSLLYNEFIVYDIAQVNVKYLVQMKFNYKY